MFCRMSRKAILQLYSPFIILLQYRSPLCQFYIISILILIISFCFPLRGIRPVNQSSVGGGFVALRIILKYHKTVKLTYYLGKKLTQASRVCHMKT